MSTDNALPEGWYWADVASLCNLQRGFDITAATNVPGEVPVYSSSGLSYRTKFAKVAPPVIITGRKGLLGRVFLIREPVWPHDTTLWADDFRGNDPSFVALMLENFHLERLDAATSVPTLNRNSLVGHMVAVPRHRSMQAGIASVFADVDALLSSIERLIAKKRAIKQGMMQELFSATHPEDEVVPLGSVAGFLSGGTPNRDRVEYWTGDVPWISATTLKDIEVADSDQHVTSKAVVAGSKMAPLGSTLVLVRGSALHSEIRASLVVAPVCFNQDVKALVPSDHIVPKFLTYSVHGNADRLLRLVTSAGNTAGVLDTKVLKEFAFWLPAREIQNRLIAVLDDVTDEIEALERRLEATRAIKQGMMQELLTGRTRLPMDVAP